MLITSLNNDKVKELVKLKDKKYRDSNNIFFVEGKDLIDEAYKNHLLIDLYLVDGTENIYNDIPCTYITKEIMKKISDMESISNYFGICHKQKSKELGNKLLILDNIQDPGNLGTIIRSAVAFNFDTIVLSKDTVDVYNPKVLRSTKGMLFNINIIVKDLVSFMDTLNEYTIYGTDVEHGIDIKEEALPNKLAIVIGNEGKGISNEVKKKCKKFIYLKMDNKCESLNAGVSASIIMYEVYHKWNMF